MTFTFHTLHTLSLYNTLIVLTYYVQYLMCFSLLYFKIHVAIINHISPDDSFFMKLYLKLKILYLLGTLCLFLLVINLSCV